MVAATLRKNQDTSMPTNASAAASASITARSTCRIPNRAAFQRARRFMFPSPTPFRRLPCWMWKIASCAASARRSVPLRPWIFSSNRRTSPSTGRSYLATGYELTPVENKQQYGEGKIPNVLTALQMERLLAPHGPYNRVLRPSDGMEPDSIAYIQCAGSRDKSMGISYCSRVCCMYAIKQAMLLSGSLPLADITVYYMDIRAFGKGYEEFFQNAMAMGIQFVKGKVAILARAKTARSRCATNPRKRRAGCKLRSTTWWCSPSAWCRVGIRRAVAPAPGRLHSNRGAENGADTDRSPGFLSPERRPDPKTSSTPLSRRERRPWKRPGIWRPGVCRREKQ